MIPKRSTETYIQFRPFLAMLSSQNNNISHTNDYYLQMKVYATNSTPNKQQKCATPNFSGMMPTPLKPTTQTYKKWRIQELRLQEFCLSP